MPPLCNLLSAMDCIPISLRFNLSKCLCTRAPFGGRRWAKNGKYLSKNERIILFTPHDNFIMHSLPSLIDFIRILDLLVSIFSSNRLHRKNILIVAKHCSTHLLCTKLINVTLLEGDQDAKDGWIKYRKPESHSVLLLCLLSLSPFLFYFISTATRR